MCLSVCNTSPKRVTLQLRPSALSFEGNSHIWLPTFQRQMPRQKAVQESSNNLAALRGASEHLVEKAEGHERLSFSSPVLERSLTEKC